MAAQITELAFLEHLSGRFNIPTPGHLTAEASGSEIRNALKKWKSKAIIKPDVLSGKRGKAGALRVVTDYVDAQKELKRLKAA